MADLDHAAPTIVAGPICVWLLVQLAAIALAALRVPLAAEYPQPAEFLAVNVLLAAQFAWVAILFPWLLRSWPMTFVAVAGAWFMLLIAAAMAAWSLSEVIAPAAYLTLFMLVIALLRHGLSRRGQFIASAIVTTYVVGGPLVWYLHLDFPATTNNDISAVFGPLLPALLHPKHPPLWAWIISCVIGSIAICCHLLRAVRLKSNNSTNALVPGH